MTRTLITFVAGSMLGLAVLATAFYLRDSDKGVYGVLCVATAGAICIVPTLGALALTLWSRGRSGTDQLMAVTGGMILRMGVVLAISFPIFLTVPQFRETKERELVFWSAILICYLGTLAWETILTARSKTARNGAAPAPTGAGE